jgi:hypothetical protein
MKSNSMNYGGIDSDSDDELMNALASGAFGQSAQYLHEDCAYCAVASAAIPCTSCNSVFYCSEVSFYGFICYVIKKVECK